MAKGANKASRNPPPRLTSFIFLFEKDKANPFSTLTPSLPRIFLWNLFIALEFKLVTNPGKLSLTKGIATFPSAFFS